MARYTPDSLVTIRPYTHQVDGDMVIIGDADRHVFLEIPAEGLDILESLAAGKTVGEAAREYEEKHQETADVEDFLDALEKEGFIGEAAAMAAGEVAEVRQAHWRWRLEWISQRTAQRLVGTPVLVACGVIFALGVALMIDDPGVLPTDGRALLFPINFAALTWATIFLSMAGIFVHELGHVIAARAGGVSAGIGVGTQLWILVAQTDMTGISMAPKRQRYVAFAIGAVIDAVSMSFLVAFIWSSYHGLIGPPQWAVLLARAVLFTTMARIIWQFFFYLRTDGYYIIATAFNCRNLMADTGDFLRNQWARFRRSPRRIDQSGIPAHEMRVVRWFSLLWFFGRLISLALYPIIILPLLWGYTYQLILLLTGNETQFNSFDFATVGIITIAIDGAGLTMWLRSLYRGARERRRQSQVPPAEQAAPSPEPAGIV